MTSMDYKITTIGHVGSMSFEKADPVFNNVFLSLMIERGSLFHNRAFGSRLHLLKRHKITPDIVDLATGYVQEALEWLKKSGRTKAITTLVVMDKKKFRLNLSIDVEVGEGNRQSFTIFYSVI